MSFWPKYARVGCTAGGRGIPFMSVGPARRQDCGQSEQTDLHEVEELDDDGRDPSEEARPTLALHDLLQPLHLDECPALFADVGRDSARVQRLDGREEQRRDSPVRVRRDGGRGEGGDVGFEGARVRREVFGRSELGRVDKDRDDGLVAFGEGSVHCRGGEGVKSVWVRGSFEAGIRSSVGSSEEGDVSRKASQYIAELRGLVRNPSHGRNDGPAAV